MVHVRALPLEFDLRMIRNSIVKCNPIQVPTYSPWPIMHLKVFLHVWRKAILESRQGNSH